MPSKKNIEKARLLVFDFHVVWKDDAERENALARALDDAEAPLLDRAADLKAQLDHAETTIDELEFQQGELVTELRRAVESSRYAQWTNSARDLLARLKEE